MHNLIIIVKVHIIMHNTAIMHNFVMMHNNAYYYYDYCYDAYTNAYGCYYV